MFRRNYVSKVVKVDYEGLGLVQNKDSNTFKILNENNVTFIFQPSKCDTRIKLLLLVSSGYSNIIARNRWRHWLSKKHHSDKVRIVFLVSSCVSICEHDLDSEHNQYQDIVHTSLLDGHRRLGYKILSGYIWTYLQCQSVTAVIKTDDNVVLDSEVLMSITKFPSVSDDHTVYCGCGPPHRNMKTLRSDTPRMLGNWSVPYDQLESDYVPDFCAGFSYAVSPSLGARLVQASVLMFGHYKDDIVLIEDSLITGVLRESLGDVDLDMLVDTRQRWLWRNILSYCPWLTVFKLTFFDELVIQKTSDRSGVQYVGSIATPKVWKFFICLHIESLLGAGENLLGLAMPEILWDVCKR